MKIQLETDCSGNGGQLDAAGDLMGVFHIRPKVAWEQIELTVTHSYLRRSFVTPRAFVSHSRFMLCGVLGHVGDTDGHLIVSQGEMDGWALMNNFHRL